MESETIKINSLKGNENWGVWKVWKKGNKRDRNRTQHEAGGPDCN